ncbi:MAG: DegT/DnrJ/EryC1/StrS family aminotransferase [Kiritimatiellia bacterium]
MKKRVFLSPPYMFGNERELVDEAFASNYIAPCGPMVERFEKALADKTAIPNVCALSSCTGALDLLFHELGVGKGDRVFCSNLTFVASIAPAVHRGAEPVFIGSDLHTWTMSPGMLGKALNEAAECGKLPKAVIAVDLYGQCCDYDALEALCDEYGVPLIVDAAEALGAGYCDHSVVAMTRVKEEDHSVVAITRVKEEDHSVVAMTRVKGGDPEGAMTRVKGEKTAACAKAPAPMAGARESAKGGPLPLLPSNLQPLSGSALSMRGWELFLPSNLQPLSGCKKMRHAGDAGWAAVFSFNGNKIITSSGGGALASRDSDVVRRALKRSQQSRENKVWYEHEELGYNYRMSNIVAAIGLGQLMNLERVLEKKRSIFNLYKKFLGDVAGVEFMPEAAYGIASRWLTVVTLPSSGKRENDSVPGKEVLQTISVLEKNNIESRPVWKPMHLQPVFKDCKVYGGDIDAEIFSSGLCLPSGTGLGRKEVERIVKLIKNIPV